MDALDIEADGGVAGHMRRMRKGFDEPHLYSLVAMLEVQ